MNTCTAIALKCITTGTCQEGVAHQLQEDKENQEDQSYQEDRSWHLQVHQKCGIGRIKHDPLHDCMLHIAH